MLEQGKALYLDYEGVEGEFRRRDDALRRGMRIDRRADVKYVRRNRPLPLEIESIAREVVDNGFGLVVVDSLTWAAGGPLTDDETATRFISACKMLPCAVWLIAHLTKSENVEKPFGSIHWWNGPRQVYSLKNADQRGENPYHIALTNLKSNDRPPIQPMAWAVHYREQDGQTWYEAADPMQAETVKQVSNRMPHWKLIRDVLESPGAATPAEIKTRLEERHDLTLSTAQIRVELGRHREFSKQEDGSWSVTR